jgi:hypothetical protein
MLHWNSIEIDFVEAAQVNRRRKIALGVGAFSVRVNAAGLAKAVLDDMLVECVSAEVFFRGE